jgi:hypothetical protein
VPHDLVVQRVYFDYPIIKLVGDQNIAFGIEPISLREKWESTSRQDTQHEPGLFQCSGEFHDDPPGDPERLDLRTTTRKLDWIYRAVGFIAKLSKNCHRADRNRSLRLAGLPVEPLPSLRRPRDADTTPSP